MKIRTKLSLSLAALLIISITIACGHEAEEDIFTGTNEVESLSVSDHPKLLNFITFDVLGGVFRSQSAAIQASILEDSPAASKEPIYGLGMTLDLPSTSTQRNLSEVSEPVVFDTSLTFSGRGGRGILILAASGNGDRFFKSEGSEDIVGYRYNPLILNFLFYKFAFQHPCLGEIRLDGEIQCHIQGDYDSIHEALAATAECFNGPADDPITLLYITKEAYYEVTYDATLKIDGNPFQSQSYRITGDIAIDGVPLKIENLIGEGASCSY